MPPNVKRSVDETRATRILVLRSVQRFARGRYVSASWAWEHFPTNEHQPFVPGNAYVKHRKPLPLAE
jgi:hypothetical protein